MMAETAVTTPDLTDKTNSATTELSKEDLIKQVKKQRLLLQKLKQKCDELNKRCSEQQQQLGITQEKLSCYTEQERVLETLKTENEELKSSIENVEAKNKQLSKQQRDIGEKLECMQLKEQSLMSALQQMELDLKKISTTNEELRKNNVNLGVEIDEWKLKETNSSELLSENEALRSSLSAVDSQYGECRQKLEDLIGKIEENDAEKRIQRQRIDELEDRERMLEERLRGSEERVSVVAEDVEVWKLKLEHAEVEKCTLQKNFEEILGQYDDLKQTLDKDAEDKTGGDDNYENDQRRFYGFNDSKIDEQSEVERLCEQVNLLEVELQNANAERDQLLFQESREQQQDCSYLQDSICRLEAEAEELRTRLESAEFETNELRAKLEEAETELENNKTKDRGPSFASTQNDGSRTEEIETSEKGDVETSTSLENEVNVEESEEKIANQQAQYSLQIDEEYKDGLNDDVLKTVTPKETLEEKNEFETCFDTMTFLVNYKDGRYDEIISKINGSLKNVDKDDTIDAWLSKVNDFLQTLMDDNKKNAIAVKDGAVELHETKLKSNEKLQESTDERIKLEDDLAETKSIVEKLTAELAKCQEMESALAAKEQEIDELRSKLILKNLDQKNAVVASESQVVDEEPNASEADTLMIDNLNQELEAVRNRLSDKDEVLNNLIDEKDALIQKLFTSNVDVEKLRAMLESAREEISTCFWKDLVTESDESKATNDNDDKLLIVTTSRLVEDLRRIKKFAVSEHETLRASEMEVRLREEEIETLRQQVLNLDADFEQMYVEHRSGVDYVMELEVTIQTKTLEISRLQEKLDETLNEKEQLEKSVANSESDELRRLNEKIKSMEDEKMTLTCDLQEMSKTNTNSKQELDKTMLEMATLHSKYANVQAENDQFTAEVNGLQIQKQDLEASLVELNGKLSRAADDLENERSKCTEKMAEVQQLTDKCNSLEKQLQSEKGNAKSIKVQMEQLQQEAKRHSLENLEFADYERVVSDLNVQMVSRTEEIERLNKEIEQQHEVTAGLRKQLEQVEEQLEQAETRGKKMKSLLVKTKKELADCKQREADLLSTSTKLHVEIEMQKQAEEVLKVENADLLSRNQKLLETQRLAKESHQRSITVFEGQINALRSQLSNVEAEYKQCQADYESYKVRVHSVLKQQKSKQPVEPALDEKEKECFEKLVEQLRVKLQETNDQLLVSNMENRTMQGQHEHVVENVMGRLKEAQSQQADLKEQIDLLKIYQENKEKEYQAVIECLHHEIESLKFTYTEQVNSLQLEHKTLLERGQRRVATLETEIVRLQQEQLKNSPVRELEVFDVANVERQEGEGSENTETVYNKPHAESLTSTVSLERLLNSETKSVSSQASLFLNDAETIESQLAASTKKLQHITEVLNESEASNIRLTEQTRLLKDEIRRLERNQERQQHAENLEYLKNIVLKFLTLQTGEERERLIPVLTMMLRLSPEEKTKLATCTIGVSPEPPENPTWGNYLPRWSGLI